MRTALSLIIALVIGALGTTATFAAEPINTLDKATLLSSYKPSGIAIRGYDTVAYFTEGKPLEGSKEFSTEWNGATWQFANQSHLDLFEASPDKYAPQYGGYCAYGVAQNYLVKIEPDQWSIIDDKLYLNYSSGVQKQWEADITGFINSANENFDRLLE